MRILFLNDITLLKKNQHCDILIKQIRQMKGAMHMKTAKEILDSKELFVFDMDGTIYLGGIPFDFAVQYINRLRENGRRVLFFTNNASHSSEFYYNKLTKLGYSPQKSEIMTAGDVSAEFILRHRHGSSVYLVGTEELKEDWKRRGIDIISDEDAKNGKNADIAVTSFDLELNYQKLVSVTRMIRLGAEYFSTHPDLNCPTEDGFIPDSGAIAALVTSSTGVSPRYFGKPYRETVEMIHEVTGVDMDKICIFGDRLYTDIALGKKHGITSVLVLTGETTEDDLKKCEKDELPDIVFPSLAEADLIL